MTLHNNIQNYINDLQDLLKVTDEQALIDKARTLWEEGQDDARYEVLEQFLESEKFAKPPDPPAPESGDDGGISIQNKPVR